MSHAAVNLLVKPSLVLPLLILVVLPLVGCVRWALYRFPLTGPPLAWLHAARRPANIGRTIGFAAALFLATALLSNVGEGLFGRGFYRLTFACLLLLAMTALGLGLYYSVSASAPMWPDPIRLHADLAPDSTRPALRIAARRIWFLSLTQTVMVTLSVAFCMFRFYVYMRAPGKDPTTLFMLFGLALAVLLGVGLGCSLLAATQTYAATLLLLNRILWSDASRGRPRTVLDDPLGDTRSDLHRLARRLERLARRGAPRGTTFPIPCILRHWAKRLDCFVQSPRSLDDAVPADIRVSLSAVGSILVGGCDPATYQRFGQESGAFDADGKPALQHRAEVSRAGRLFLSLTQHAEPTDKLLSTALRVSAVVLLTILAVTGKIGMDKFFDMVKPTG